jgi:hypothetical protein
MVRARRGNGGALTGEWNMIRPSQMKTSKQPRYPGFHIITPQTEMLPRHVLRTEVSDLAEWLRETAHQENTNVRYDQ